MCVPENLDLESHLLQEMRISCTLLQCTLNMLAAPPVRGQGTSRITPIPISSILRVCCSASEGEGCFEVPPALPKNKG